MEVDGVAKRHALKVYWLISFDGSAPQKSDFEDQKTTLTSFVSFVSNGQTFGLLHFSTPKRVTQVKALLQNIRNKFWIEAEEGALFHLDVSQLPKKAGIKSPIRMQEVEEQKVDKKRKRIGTDSPQEPEDSEPVWAIIDALHDQATKMCRQLERLKTLVRKEQQQPQQALEIQAIEIQDTDYEYRKAQYEKKQVEILTFVASICTNIPSQSMYVGDVRFNSKGEYIVIPPFREPIKRSEAKVQGSLSMQCYLGVFVPDYDIDDLLPPPSLGRKRMGLSYIRAYNTQKSKDAPYLLYIENFDIDDEGPGYAEAMLWKSRRRAEQVAE